MDTSPYRSQDFFLHNIQVIFHVFFFVELFSPSQSIANIQYIQPQGIIHESSIQFFCIFNNERIYCFITLVDSISLILNNHIQHIHKSLYINFTNRKKTTLIINPSSSVIHSFIFFELSFIYSKKPVYSFYFLASI